MEKTNSLELVEVTVQGSPDCVGQRANIAALVRPSMLKEDQEKDLPPSPKMETLDPKWISSIREKRPVRLPRRLKSSSGSSSCSFHRFPQRFRKFGEEIYVPQMISIGPFHYDGRKDKLRAMEEHKWHYLNDFLIQNGEHNLERFLMAVKLMEDSVRECYSEKFDIDSNSFVEMIVLDCCFLVRLFNEEMKCEEYMADPWQHFLLVIDLIMLENQIPFFVLQHLYDLMNIPGTSLSEKAIRFYSFSFHEPNTRIQHLLHLIHCGMTALPIKENSRPGALQIMQCASELQQAGIRFQMAREDNNYLDVKFQEGVVEMYPIMVSSFSKPLYSNLFAFEQCYRHCKAYVTAYTLFMDFLINFAKDVKTLCDSGIIKNGLGSNEAVADLFNTLATETLVREDFHLSEVVQNIMNHYGRTWPKLQVTLKRGYFKNPWAIISFCAGVLLLVLAFTQTFFTAFPKFAMHE